MKNTSAGLEARRELCQQPGGWYSVSVCPFPLPLFTGSFSPSACGVLILASLCSSLSCSVAMAIQLLLSSTFKVWGHWTTDSQGKPWESCHVPIKFLGERSDCLGLASESFLPIRCPSQNHSLSSVLWVGHLVPVLRIGWKRWCVETAAIFQSIFHHRDGRVEMRTLCSLHHASVCSPKVSQSLSNSLVNFEILGKICALMYDHYIYQWWVLRICQVS